MDLIYHEPTCICMHFEWLCKIQKSQHRYWWQLPSQEPRRLLLFDPPLKGSFFFQEVSEWFSQCQEVIYELHVEIDQFQELPFDRHQTLPLFNWFNFLWVKHHPLLKQKSISRLVNLFFTQLTYNLFSFNFCNTNSDSVACSFMDLKYTTISST
jgi:hypothetical protein